MSNRDEILNYVKTAMEKQASVKIGKVSDQDIHLLVDYCYDIDLNVFVIETVCGAFYHIDARFPKPYDSHCKMCFLELVYEARSSVNDMSVKEHHHD